MASAAQAPISSGIPNSSKSSVPFDEDGNFDKDAAIDPQVWGFIREGELLAEEGRLDDFSGMTLARTPAGKVLVGSFTVKALKEGEARITLSDCHATAPPLIVGNGGIPDTARAVSQDLVLHIGQEEPPVANGFQLDINASWKATRAVSAVAISLGEKEGASDAYAAEDGDAKWAPGVLPYSFYVENGADTLVRDYRALHHGDVAWNVQYTSTDASRKLLLDWDASRIADYDLALVADGVCIDMKQVSQFELSGKAANFQIIACEKKTEFQKTFQLEAGWNLIGALFDFDAVALKALKGEDGTLYVHDFADDSFCIFQGDNLVAGNGLWVYRQTAETVTVTGKSSSVKGVELQAGWNLVTPLMETADEAMVLPQGAQVWLWTADGYRWIDEDKDLEAGVGYWFYVEEAATIWTTDEN